MLKSEHSVHILSMLYLGGLGTCPPETYYAALGSYNSHSPSTFCTYTGNFLKGFSNSSIELPEAGVWELLRDFQYFNESKLSKLLHLMQK